MGNLFNKLRSAFDQIPISGQVPKQEKKEPVHTTFFLKTHTVLVLIGPMNSGKTHFANDVIINGIKKSHGGSLNIQHISSDAIRRELLGDPGVDKMDKRMVQVSEQAFSVLYNRLENATSYPVNADLVIIDATGLDKKWKVI